MISAPDVVAFTKEDDYEEDEAFSYEPPLPEEYSVPLFPFASPGANPWSKLSSAKFTRDFILISEFSEQVGPQPLLTIPDDSKVQGTFDLNYFSLRIMSVDYQASSVGHLPGCPYPKLNFVEDSKVVLGDSKEGAFAYVHHLTLYDLEARGFVRPFCMAYISADELKIMQMFQDLSVEFSKASECLKTGNRKAFASELEKKLKDLDYTRTVLHNETEIQKKNNEKGYYTTQAIEKANELASVEKSIIEHQDLLKQIRSYPYSKLKDPEFRPYEPECTVEQTEGNVGQGVTNSSKPEEPSEIHLYPQHSSAYIPKLIKAKSTKCFAKKLKTLQELCDVYFFTQTLDQLHQIEKMFRGDVCYLLTNRISLELLKRQTITNFLFEELVALYQGPPLDNPGDKGLDACPVVKTPAGLEPYKSSVECVPIKMDQESGDAQEMEAAEPVPCNSQDNVEYLDAELKGSVSSGESIEVLGTEKSAGALAQPENQANLSQTHLNPQLAREKAVSRRTISEDSIEVLSTCPSEALIPDDFRASYPSAINEEPYADEEEDGLRFSPISNMNGAEEMEGNPEPENLLPADSTCCIGKESPNFLKPQVDSALKHCDDDGVVSIPPQPYRHGDQGFQVNFTDYSSHDGEALGNLNYELDPHYLSSSQEVSRTSLDKYLDSTGHSSSRASTSSDRTPSPSPLGGQSGEKHRKKAGQNALRFIRQYPFAHPAIYSLLSGRTLIVLGEEKAIVEKLVNALSIFVPNTGTFAKPVKPWATSPLHITDFQKWKLIGLQRSTSPAGVSVLHSLHRYSRYISVLDADSKTLRCPQYRGALIPRLADHRTQIKRGSTYSMHVQTILTQLCSKAFLFTFCHHLHLPIREGETEASVATRRLNFLKLHLGLANEDSKVVLYLAELLKRHFLQDATRGVSPVLRFDYVPSALYKI